MSNLGRETEDSLFAVSDFKIYHEPVLISACLVGIPCRWHGRRPNRRAALVERLKKEYVLVTVCREQLGAMPKPRTSESLDGTAAQVLGEGLRIIAPETVRDITRFYINGADYTLEIAQVLGARRVHLKGGSPSCDHAAVTGEILRRVASRTPRRRLRLGMDLLRTHGRPRL